MKTIKKENLAFLIYSNGVKSSFFAENNFSYVAQQLMGIVILREFNSTFKSSLNID